MTPPPLHFSPRMMLLQENKANYINSLLSIVPPVMLPQTHADGNANISCGKKISLGCNHWQSGRLPGSGEDVILQLALVTPSLSPSSLILVK